MLKLYPIPEETKKCNHFAVKVNGQPIEVEITDVNYNLTLFEMISSAE